MLFSLLRGLLFCQTSYPSLLLLLLEWQRHHRQSLLATFSLAERAATFTVATAVLAVSVTLVALLTVEQLLTISPKPR